MDNKENKKDKDEMMNEKKQEEKVVTDETENKLLDLKKELENKNEEIKKLNDSYLRLQADFVNYKKRVEKDKISTIAYANEDLVSGLLPIIDNFERAIDAVEDKEDSFFQGMEMIYDQLIKFLADNGLEKIEALGKQFDPNYHHAAFMEESEDVEEGVILEVYQKGYKLKDKVIRPSMVKVAKQKNLKEEE